MNRRRFLQSVGVIGASITLGVGAPKPVRALARLDDTKEPIDDDVPCLAYPLPLTAVRLTGGPLKHTQDLDAAYLLQLDPDRMMANLRKQAGLVPKAASYGGWDSEGRSLAGHISGHYLSATSLMYAATGNERFKQCAAYIVSEMEVVQNKNRDGYLGGQEGGKQAYEQLSQGVIRSGGFDLNGLWSPWYVEHKIFAGLRDAYRYTGNANALNVECKFAAWVDTTLHGLTDAQDQTMLNTEFGGMNEVLADLYADTGDKRWLALSDKFQHHAVLDPLSNRDDILGGLHGNTQIPKLIGSLARYVYTGDATDGDAARFFWDTVVNHHTFATGGHGQNEYFGPPDKLSAYVEGRTDESCNVYNMLKLTRELFAIDPDIKYGEFHERALFNHVLGSMDPTDGSTCYMVPVGQGVQREYQDMFENFTCCVGTGMENHALHGYGIYYEANDRLWVNVYAPSTATWKAQAAQLTMDTTFPEGETASLTLTLKKPSEFTLTLRRPSWANDGFAISVNGKAFTNVSTPGSYVDIKRLWKNGDVVTLTMPKTLHQQPLPDNPRRTALMWGPLVLAGDLGPEPDSDTHVSTPILVAADQPLDSWLKPVQGSPGSFQATGVAYDPATSLKVDTVQFEPFYQLHRRTYAAYWDLYTPEEWTAKSDQIASDQAQQKKLQALTVSYVQPGQMQSERDFNEQGEDSTPDRVMDRACRRGSNWFSFDMPVDPASPLAVVITYNTAEAHPRTFNITADGQTLATQTITPDAVPKFLDIQYALPAAIVAGKTKITLRFQATQTYQIAAIFGIRIIRTGGK